MFERRQFKIASVNEFYPTPRERIAEPADTPLNKGDLVRILVGPATDKIGEVVVERNRNYVDYEPYAGAESIGVQVVETANFHPELLKELGGIANTSKDGSRETVVRWFDSSDQLELLLRPVVDSE